MTRRLILLRHGRTEWNDLGRAQGHADIGLDDVGRAQAAAVAPYLASLGPSALWTSDLARARETAAYLEQATGLVAVSDRRLREYDVGARQGLRTPEFARRFPAEFAAWHAGEDMPAIPGAETHADVEVRILPAVREAWDSLAPGKTGVVVTHGAALKVAVLGLLGWPASHTASLVGLGNCHWVTLTPGRGDSDRVRLRTWNQGLPPAPRPAAG